MHHDQYREAEIKACAFVREVLRVQPGRPALPVDGGSCADRADGCIWIMSGCAVQRRVTFCSRIHHGHAVASGRLILRASSARAGQRCRNASDYMQRPRRDVSGLLHDAPSVYGCFVRDGCVHGSAPFFGGMTLTRPEA